MSDFDTVIKEMRERKINHDKSVSPTLHDWADRLEATRRPLTKQDLADALDCFWNASLGATHPHQDDTANTVVAGIVSGLAAVAARLRE